MPSLTFQYLPVPDTTLAFNLINDIDIPGTEARIQKFRTENAAIIEANIQRDESYAVQLREQEEAERKQREAHARELARLEEEERELREQEKRDLIDKLERSDKDAASLVARARVEHAKRVKARMVELKAQAPSAANPAQTARALRSRAQQSNIPDVPHVPLQDDWYSYTDLFTVRSDGYYDPISKEVRADSNGIMRAGGYSVEEAWERAIRSAVAGLDIVPLSGLEGGSNMGGQAILPSDAVLVTA